MSDDLTDADRALLAEASAAASPRSVETTAILIAGMHRSGTSALVRVLNLLGVDLPTELYPARPDNPLGYWEPVAVVEAHEKFLAAIGSSFDDVSSLPAAALRGEDARGLEDRLVQILEDEFEGMRQFVVKDPRLCRVVPIWIAALTRFGAAPRFVLTVRNPLEVAASLKVRNEYSTTKSLLLWLRHMLEAEWHSRGFPRSIVSFDQLLRDWQGTVDRIGHDLGVSWPRRSHAAHAEIEQFLSPGSRHHSFELDELRARADIVDWVKTAYEVFAAAAAGDRIEENVLDTLRGELDRADSAFGPLLAELELAQHEQEETLAAQATTLAETAAAAKAATKELDEAGAKIARLNADVSRREEKLAAARTEAAATRQQVEQLQAELDRQQNELAEAKAGASALEERIQTLVAESEVLTADARRADDEAANLRSESEARDEQLEVAREAVAQGRRQQELLTLELARQMDALSAKGLEADQFRAESEALQAANAKLDSELSQLQAEKSGLGEALAQVRHEADRTRERLAVQEAVEAETRELLDVTKEELDAALARLAQAEAAFADRDAQLATLERRLFAKPRSRRRALSQFMSWLVHPRRWHLAVSYLRVRLAGTFRADAYLAENPDVEAAGVDPLMHYLEHGIREGRTLAPPPPVAYEISTPTPPPPAVPETETTTPAPQPVVAVTPRLVQAPPSGPLAPADYSDFVVLLSRQRSGTNPLRAVLGTHPDVFCFNEVFNLPDRDADEPFLRESNFFTFLERYAKNDVRRMTPDNHERLFLDFLEYLRCLSPKQYAVIDVKYNTMHFLTRPWQERGSPYLLELIDKHGLYVLNVTRRNYVRYVLSSLKAWRSDRYTVDDSDAAYVDWTTDLAPGFLLSELEHCRDEDHRIRSELPDQDRVLTCDYAEIFPGEGVPISPEFLDRFAAWRGIPNRFALDTEYRKQSTLPLRETIENYAQIEEALRDGPFAYCLEDEPSYKPPKPPTRSSYSEAQRESWRSTIGSDPDAFVENICRTRPEWIRGSLSEDDARFLFQRALEADVDEAVEIGTASGFSTAILAHAFHFRATAGRGAAEWRVRSYDILERLYYDENRLVGDATRELLSAELLAHVDFNAPATAADVVDRHAPDSIGFLFVDANHRHPWPALDLLAVLPALRPGGLVLMHDINLPRIHPEFPDWGASNVFEGLYVEKLVPDSELPNVGALIVPDDKERLRGQLLAVLDGHPWEVDVPEDVVAHARR